MEEILKQQPWSHLILSTSYVTPESIKKLPEEGILPIYIIRNMTSNPVLSGWQGSSIHFKELSPSWDLLNSWKKGVIERPEFSRKYAMELAESKVSIEDCLKRIWNLCSMCNTGKAVLLGYGPDPQQCPRSVLGDLINDLGLLATPVKELYL